MEIKEIRKNLKYKIKQLYCSQESDHVFQKVGEPPNADMD